MQWSSIILNGAIINQQKHSPTAYIFSGNTFVQCTHIYILVSNKKYADTLKGNIESSHD